MPMHAAVMLLIDIAIYRNIKIFMIVKATSYIQGPSLADKAIQKHGRINLAAVRMTWP